MDEIEPINKQRIGPILWREKWVILASIVVMVALSGIYTLTQAKVYQASAILQVNLQTATPGSTDTTNANQGLAQNYANLLTSSGFLSSIRQQVDGGRLSVDSLQSKITASALPQTALVEVHATGSSPQQAQTIGQQVISGFLASLQATAATHTAQLQNQLQAQIGGLSARISALQAQPQTPSVVELINSLKASRQALINQNATLVANGVAQGTSTTVSAPPQASSSAISPKKSLNLIAGLLLGVLLGLGVAWLRHVVRPAIHSADDVAAVVDLPLLASIPLKSRFKPDDPGIREAYGVLQANLAFALRNDNMRMVTFVGFNPGVGKTSAVEGLARASSRGDRQLLIVDGDMRAATLSARFGYRDHPGLVDVLQGASALDAVLAEVDEGLWLLPTRPARVNAANLLAGSRTFALMAELRERFDLVAIDSPPLTGLADGLILASQSDAVVVVVRAGITKPSDLVNGTNSLRHHMTPIAGTVVFEELRVEAYYGAALPEPTSSSAAVVS
jgi:Mrp family chromosome partitioning ATPase